MPDPRKDQPSLNLPDPDPENTDPAKQPESPADNGKTGKKTYRAPKNFRPIILCLALTLTLGVTRLPAQANSSISLGAAYSDNAFQLSETDLSRFDDEDPDLAYAKTTDDLTLSARLDAGYTFRYKWWRFTPSFTASVAQNVSNTDKQRRDALLRFRVDRYYWNATALYGFYPFAYVRDITDSDGSNALESYNYGRNLYRGDLNLKPLRGTTVQLHGRFEQYFYNERFTEYDGDAITLGAGLRHSFPIFSLGAMYYWRGFDNTGAKTLDCSYESNRYSGDIILKAMPLSEGKKNGPAWQPSLGLSYEERFYQSDDYWYGGRIYKSYSTDAGIDFLIDRDWNLSLDYSHIFRNVESDVQAVLDSKEYAENKVSATLKYSF